VWGGLALEPGERVARRLPGVVTDNFREHGWLRTLQREHVATGWTWITLSGLLSRVFTSRFVSFLWIERYSRDLRIPLEESLSACFCARHATTWTCVTASSVLEAVKFVQRDIDSDEVGLPCRNKFGPAWMCRFYRPKTGGTTRLLGTRAVWTIS
jgi:hypothetical protein